MAISIKFLGGIRTVTGSSHLVTADRSQVLLDAGLFQGHRDESYKINTTFRYNPHKLNALILSHAHIDHSGNIPVVLKNGMRCKIYTTHATRDLCKLMLEDSGKIQEEDIKYVNKINKRMGLPLRKPLYTRREAARANKKFHPLSYGERFCVARNIFARLHDAGHILGSSIIVLDIKDQDRVIRLGYAVDLGRKNLPLLNAPQVPAGLDYLIIETTYGARFHAPAEETKFKFRDAIKRTVERGGKVLIPSFTLERAQEVLYFLNELLKEKVIPAIPIYVDSPLATDITEVFKTHINYLNPQIRSAIGAGNSPFEFVNLRFIREQNESKRLNTDKRPMIIIAGNGMCEAGRILHHLKNNIEDSRNTIIIVGYMAKDTLGKRIVERMPIVRIFGVEYELNAEVEVINSISAHADKNELLDFIAACLPLKKVFLVHGDMDQSQALLDALSERNINAVIPEKEEEVFLD
ncbi:MAG: MBL fold metallo-hydrolase [Candidatus Omnitrophica bacterium]|nr:MBL fold metallo-hydrolase [Candidatus Omnitrophota bacterium]